MSQQPDAGPPTLICNAPVATVGDVAVGQLITNPNGQDYAVGRDTAGFYAISTITPAGDCAVHCSPSGGDLVDECHGGVWNTYGASERDGGMLHFLAIHFSGHGPTATIAVDSFPNEVDVAPSVRFPPP